MYIDQTPMDSAGILKKFFFHRWQKKSVDNFWQNACEHRDWTSEYRTIASKNHQKLELSPKSNNV